MTSAGNFERFQYFNFEKQTKTKKIEKAQTFFKKLDYHFLVESTKIENALFPYKTALSKDNVKTNRMGSTKWTYNEVLPLTTLFFRKIYFNLRISYKDLI